MSPIVDTACGQICLNSQRPTIQQEISFRKQQLLPVTKLIACDLQDVRVTRFKNGEHRHLKVTTARGTKFGVSTVEAVHTGFGKHGVVFNFGLTNSGAIVGHQNQFGAAGTKGTESFTVPKLVFTGFHDEFQFGIDVVGGGVGWHDDW